jgi:hypothetical protein
MKIERNDKEIVIRVPAGTNLIGVQRLLDFIKFRETASKSKLTQEQIDQLAKESKKHWWSENKDRFDK